MPGANSFYGPPGGIDSKDYLLYMAKPNPLALPYSLESHTFGSVSQNLTEALRFNRTYLRNGRIVTKSIVAREAEETSRDYTIGFPNGVLTTPAMFQARNGGCEADFYQVYLCPSNTCYEHFYAFPDSRLDPPVEAEDPITVDDTVELYETSTLHTNERLLYMHIQGTILVTVDLGEGAGTLQAVHAAEENCPGCGNCINRVYIGGNDGAAASETSYMAVSTNRGGSFTEIDLDTLTSGDTSGLIVTSINSDGDYVWITLADDIDPATVASGVMAYSTDAGATWTVPTSPTAGMFATFQLEGKYYVAGDGGEIWGSEDGITWTEVTHTATTDCFLAADVDEEESVAYIVGESGAAVVFDGNSVVDISGSLPGTPDDLYGAIVLAQGRVQFAGATGYGCETYDNGDSWVEITVTGASTTIQDVQGDEHRSLAVQGDTMYRRDVLSGNQYTAVPMAYSASISGTFSDVDRAEGVNYYFAVATTGEVVLFAPCGPDFCADIAAA